MLGSNVPMTGGLEQGFKTADKWKCECIQFYITPSRTWKVPELTKDDIESFKNAWKDSSVKEVVGHIPFIVNLASADSGIRERSITRMFQELDRAAKFKVKYMVLHPGSYTTSTVKKGLEHITYGLQKVVDTLVDDYPMILLETMAGQGTNLGSRFKDLHGILSDLGHPKQVGVCMDTAHIFEAGYNISGYDGFDTIMTKFDTEVGLKNLKVIHLNDSKTGLGSKHDRHAVVGRGKIGLQFFHALLRDSRFTTVPKILEIPDRDGESKESLIFLRELRKKKKVAPTKKTILMDDFFD